MAESTDGTQNAKDLLKGVIDGDLLDLELVQSIFAMYKENLPALFATLSGLVGEQREATTHFANVDKESTADYNDILNGQLEFLRGQCKNAKTQEELEDLYKQFQDILDRLREEKREQRDHMEKLDKNQKESTKFIAGLLATAATATLAIVFSDKIKSLKK